MYLATDLGVMYSSDAGIINKLIYTNDYMYFRLCIVLYRSKLCFSWSFQWNGKCTCHGKFFLFLSVNWRIGSGIDKYILFLNTYAHIHIYMGNISITSFVYVCKDIMYWCICIRYTHIYIMFILRIYVFVYTEVQFSWCIAYIVCLHTWERCLVYAVCFYWYIKYNNYNKSSCSIIINLRYNI